ncbi:MAG: hypothetical protein HGA73_01160, partial [Syntrophaceae bacterium]|nr:hypothetical protein [Syntrophaceae bacterium]
QGDLVITVATGGKSPALAKKLRKELEERYGPEYETLLRIMGELRAKIIDRGEGSDENRKVFETLVDSDILALIREGKWKKVEKIVKDVTGVAIDLRPIEDSGFRLQEEKGITTAGSGPAGKSRPQAGKNRVKGKGSRGK